MSLNTNSIKNIEICIQIQKHGLKCDVKDIFLNPTIKELAKCIHSTLDESKENVNTQNQTYNKLTDNQLDKINLAVNKKITFKSEEI